MLEIDRNFARRAILFLFSVTALLWGALVNRFPLVDSDTGTYLSSALTLDVAVDRPIFYSLFLRATGWLGPGLWGPVLAQATILAALVLLLIRTARPKTTDLQTAGIVLSLAAGTGLPWLCGCLMPDIFTAYLALTTYLLAVHGGELGKWKRVLLGGAFCFSLLAHSSHLPVAALVLALLSTAAALRKNLAFPAALFALSLLIIPCTNKLLDGQAYFSKAGHVFIMDRLIDSRIVDRLLEDHCAEKNYALCPYKDAIKELGGAGFLFAKSPLEKIGGWEFSGAVMTPVIIDAFLYYPIDNAKSILGNFVRQFFSFAAGKGLVRYEPESFVYPVIKEKYPRNFADFQASRQEAGGLIRFIIALSVFHRLVAVAALVMAGMLLGPWAPRLPSGPRSFIAITLFYCVGNALVCGATSEVSARYQARVAWLAVFSVLLAAAGLMSHDPVDADEAISLPLTRLTLSRTTTAAALVVILLPVFVALKISRSYATTSPSPYLAKPVVVWPASERIVRKIPLSTLQDARGLALGVQVKSHTASGREFIGTVTQIGAGEITVESLWEMVRWSTVPPTATSALRTLPLSIFPNPAELKPGDRIKATTADGLAYTAKVVTIGKADITVAVESP